MPEKITGHIIFRGSGECAPLAGERKCSLWAAAKVAVFVLHKNNKFAIIVKHFANIIQAFLIYKQ